LSVDVREQKMARAGRIVACALVALLLCVTVGAAADAAANHHPVGRHHHPRLAQDGSSHVLLALGRLDRRLGLSIRHRLAPLPQADAATIRSNAASDRARVEAAATAYSSAPSHTHLDAARTLLHRYHPERYVGATALLRRARHAQAAIARLRLRVTPLGPASADLRFAAGLLAGVHARDFTARTTSAAMRDHRVAIRTARALVRRVRAELAAG
jgi:hypothetical protein